jgi:hypothetical protein
VSAPPASYSLALPPGWARIPLQRGTRTALEEKVFRGIERIPADVPRDQGMAYRAWVRRRVERMVGEARRAGGLDLYVPVRTRRPLPASFLVAEVGRGEGGVAAPEDATALARLAGERRAGAAGELRTVGEGLGVRWEYVRAREEEGPEGPVAASRRVDYVLPVPADRARWLAVSHSTAVDGDPAGPYAQALTDLFDALMTTFRWAY